jgi:hypothetical protein
MLAVTLQIDSFFHAGLPKEMMAPAHTFIEPE